MASTINVRWLGAFRRIGPRGQRGLNSAARWEVTSMDMRPWALQLPRTKVGGAQIGLLVDPTRSKIAGAFIGDIWSETIGHKVRWGRHLTSRPRSGGFLAHQAKVLGYGYDEIIGVPVFIGVVVHPLASKRVRTMAKRVAKLIGLPYLGSATSKEVARTVRRYKG